MPVRPFSREQQWLLPPSVDDALAAGHPARFVAAFVDAVETEVEMGVVLRACEEIRAIAMLMAAAGRRENDRSVIA